MTLRLRLFLLFGGLVVLLVLAQWWWVRVLTRDLSSEVDEVASSVGHSVVAFFSDGAQSRVFECLGEGCEDVALPDEDFEARLRAGEPREKHHERRSDAPPPEGGGATVATPETKVLVRKFRRDDAEAGGERDTGFGYSYHADHSEDDPSPGEESSRAKTHIKLHIEHEDGARYLRMRYW